MFPRQHLSVLIRVVMVYLVLTFLFARFGSLYTYALTGLFTKEINILFPRFTVDSFHAENYHGQEMISLTVTLRNEAGSRISPSEGPLAFTSKTIAANQYLHPILLFSVIAAFPVSRIRLRIKLVVLALPFLAIVEILDVPLLLAFRCQESLNMRLSHEGFYLGSFWIDFLHTGGRHALSLLASCGALGAFGFFNSISGGAKVDRGRQRVGRNDPCPCGSGKKYKVCCLKIASS